MENVKILFFNLPEKLAIVGELMAYYARKEDFDAKIVADQSIVSGELTQAKNGIVIFKVENKPDLQAAVALLKTHKKLIKKGVVKFACFSMVKSKKVDSILQKYGCKDILNPQTLKSKTFGFKIDFWSKNIRAQMRKQEQDLSFKPTNDGPTPEEGAKKEREDFVFSAGLELESDIWISKHRNDHKKILRRFLIRFLGPSPHIAQWTEMENRDNSGQTVYRFDLEDEDGLFVAEEGAWFFAGSRPEFDWKSRKWSFSSDRPHLYFYRKSDGKTFSRVKPANGSVEIADNSTYGLMKEEAIDETCNSEFSFGKDKESEDSGSGVKGGNEQAPSHWDGESNTDNLGPSHLKGKNSQKADELDDLKGQSTYQEENLGDNLEGKNSESSIDYSDLKGKVDHSKEESPGNERHGHHEDDLGGHYGGKSKTDHVGNGPLAGKTESEGRSDEEGSEPGFSKEEDLGGHYGGKGSTDEIDRDPLEGPFGLKKKRAKKSQDSEFSEEDLGGHYGAELGAGIEETGPKEGKKSSFSEEDLGGHYNGESSTDELGHGPLSGSVASQQSKEQEQKKSQFSEEDLGGNYGGESSTDELDRSPLNGELSADKKNLKERRNSEFSEDDLGGHYDGKGASEELDRDPLSGGLKSAKMKRANGGETSFEEDDLGGHYGGKGKTDSYDESPMSEKRSSSDDELERDGLDSALNSRKKKKGPTYGLEEGPFTGLEDSKENDDLQDAGAYGLKRKKKFADTAFEHEEDVEEVDDELTRDDRDLLGGGPRQSKRPGQLTEEDLIEALDGKLAHGSSSSDSEEEGFSELELGEAAGKLITGKAIEEPKLSGDEIIDGSASLNLESGELKVVLTVIGDEGDLNILCSFEDFFPDELVVVASSSHLKLETEVHATIKLEYLGKKKSVKAKGKVSEVEELDERTASVTVSLSPVDEEEYENFMDLYQDRQESIHEFMKLARGVE